MKNQGRYRNGVVNLTLTLLAVRASRALPVAHLLLDVTEVRLDVWVERPERELGVGAVEARPVCCTLLPLSLAVSLSLLALPILSPHRVPRITRRLRLRPHASLHERQTRRVDPHRLSWMRHGGSRSGARPVLEPVNRR
jgi:hypothetical protein